MTAAWLALAGGPAVAATMADTPAAALARADYGTVAGQPLLSPEAVERYYRARGYGPAWTGGDGSALAALQAAIGDAAAHGLIPADYHAAPLALAIAEDDRTAIEMLASDAWLTLGAHLLRGKVNPETVEPDWTAEARSADLVARLAAALAAGEVRQSLAGLAPDNASYRALQAALAKYRLAAGGEGWPPKD